MIKNVELSKQAKKDLKKVPSYIVEKLFEWIDSVEEEGLEETRMIIGFHDESLKGKRRGQRSIRLSKHYRAIYKIKNYEIEFCEVQEVNKHDY